MKVVKRNGQLMDFDLSKIEMAVKKAFESQHQPTDGSVVVEVEKRLAGKDEVPVEEIQDMVENILMQSGHYQVAKAFILYREKRSNVREWVAHKQQFIHHYKESSNTANATIDDNSNVGGKNIGILNAEIHKQDNVLLNRAMVMGKLKELYPDFDCKNYERDLSHHIIYKNDESSFAGAISPYCCSITMYPFLTGGIKGIGGLSAAPKNLDSFCGMYINLIFATSAMFAGAVATSEFLLYFDWFARKEWGDNYWQKPDTIISTEYCLRKKTIQGQIHQYWQQVIYSINQPAAARGLQSAFVNFSYFDKPFFEGMFGDFYFPDGTRPIWNSLNWLQKEFMMWFNQERLRCMLTFPVESFALVYRDGIFLDEENAKFVAEEYARGHSFFTYISDTVDSLSSCCFRGDTKVLWKSSTGGIHLTSLKELHETKWEPYKKNLKIFHNGSWVRGKSIKLPKRMIYEVSTFNNKVFYMTDNHINLTLEGEKQTSELTTNDYLLFNTSPLQAIPENDLKLTYEQGYLIGMFLGDGTLCANSNGKIYHTELSLNVHKYQSSYQIINHAIKLIGGKNDCCLGKLYNNVYPCHISSKKVAEFIIQWTNWKPGTHAQDKELNLDCLLQSYDFRKGILDGWYMTDGGNSNRCYTASSKLAECMEALITSLGMQSIIDISDRTDEKVVIREQVFDRNFPLYCVRFYTLGNHRTNKDVNQSWIKRNNSIYFRIKSIKQIGEEENVYCIEMRDQDEPYFTLPSGLITHNCRLKNTLQTKEFNFTNGNIGVQTGSKSVISLNLSRIVQDYMKVAKNFNEEDFKPYFINILERVYKYHTAYNELLWDMYNANLLPVYKAGFINLDKQYLTIGLNGLNQAAEFMGLKCTNNEEYARFCQFIFGIVKEQNALHKTKKTTYNTEQVPAESLAIKNYNWDKQDGYWVPEDTNLYASYIFKPNDPEVSILDKIVMHGSNYIGDYLDGGAAAHLNLSEHLSVVQYEKLLKFAAENGCQYLTFNVPNSECRDCGYITKHPIFKCPKCGSEKIDYYDRVIGYLTKINNWSAGRQIEQKTRIYEKV